MQIRVGDIVKVRIGDDQGVEAKVLVVDREAGKVVVEGVNRVYKHVRRSQQAPQGGRLSKEMPVPISKVQLVCPLCGKPARMGAKYLDDGSKVRICRKCKGQAGQLAPPRPARAKRASK